MTKSAKAEGTGSSTEIQTRTRCPKCELSSGQTIVPGRGCFSCQDGWVYAWVDPSSLYLSDNESVQATVDSAVRKVLANFRR